MLFSLAQRTALILALGCGIALAWWLPNWLSRSPSARLTAKFVCLSYDPAGAGQSPLLNKFATAEQVEHDLTLLSGITNSIRTYSAIQGNYEIPALARTHGLRVWQGIWLGGNREQNQREMAKGIELANRYPDVIGKVVVGNEVLLRRDLPVRELAADIDYVRRSVKQPVGYADVGDFWDKFPEVAGHVDIALIHLLPYWEDSPVYIGDAVSWAEQKIDHFAQMFTRQKIVVGEIGWPTRGRQRGASVPSRVNQAHLLAGFLKLAERTRLEYNFFQAFDQSWKYSTEGDMGAAWGIYTESRQPKYDLGEPIVENPDWLTNAGLSILWGFTFLGILYVRTSATTALAARSIFLAFLLGAIFEFARVGVTHSAFDVHSRLAAAFDLFGQVLLAVLLICGVVRRVPLSSQVPVRETTTRLRSLIRLKLDWPLRPFEDIFNLFVWAAAVDQLLLVFDPRYRLFPTVSFSVPVVVAVVRLLNARSYNKRGGVEEVALSTVLILGAVSSILEEGVLNTQALVWNCMATILGLSLVAECNSAYGRTPTLSEILAQPGIVAGGLQTSSRGSKKPVVNR